RGARHLMLVGRSGASSDEAQAAIASLETAGVRVKVRKCDVTRRRDMSVVFAEIDETMPPLRGVVHAAMVIDDGMARNLTSEQIQRVLAPKILGARHLDR